MEGKKATFIKGENNRPVAKLSFWAKLCQACCRSPKDAKALIAPSRPPPVELLNSSSTSTRSQGFASSSSSFAFFPSARVSPSLLPAEPGVVAPPPIDLYKDHIDSTGQRQRIYTATDPDGEEYLYEVEQPELPSSIATRIVIPEIIENEGELSPGTF